MGEVSFDERDPFNRIVRRYNKSHSDSLWRMGLDIGRWFYIAGERDGRRDERERVIDQMNPWLEDMYDIILELGKEEPDTHWVLHTVKIIRDSMEALYAEDDTPAVV